MIKKLTKQNKYLLMIIGVIVIVLTFSLLISMGGGNNNSSNIIQNAKPINNIQSNIINFKFSLPPVNLPTQLYVYQVSNYSKNDFDLTAKRLNMNKFTDDKDFSTYKYEDEKGNSIEFGYKSNLINIKNYQNNEALNGITKENILSKLSSIFNLDFTNFYEINENTSGKYTSINWGYKIKPYSIIKDFNSPIAFSSVLSSDGNLSSLRWEYNMPTVSANAKLISIDYVKNNFLSINKGIYPDFPVTEEEINGKIESIPNIENFKGNLDIYNVEMVYFWSDAQKDVLVPSYRFSAHFNFDSGLKTDGTIIVPAVVK